MLASPGSTGLNAIMLVLAGLTDRLGRSIDHVRTHRVLGSVEYRASFVSDLVLEECDEPALGNDHLRQLLVKTSLAPGEVRVEVDEHSQKRDAEVIGLIPMVHVGLEPLPRTVPIHPQT